MQPPCTWLKIVLLFEMICNLQTLALSTEKKLKGVIEMSIIAVTRKLIKAAWLQDTTRIKILNKMLVLKQWLRFLENDFLLGSIFLADNEIPVLPSFVSTVMPALSVSASAYTPCFMKHISNHRIHRRVGRQVVIISPWKYSVKQIVNIFVESVLTELFENIG